MKPYSLIIRNCDGQGGILSFCCREIKALLHDFAVFSALPLHIDDYETEEVYYANI